MKAQLTSPTLSPSEVDINATFCAFRESQSLALRDQLVCKHLHLVHNVARRFSGLGESIDDLIQEGTIGLLRAVDLFDPDRNVKFSTYACHLITSQIQHYLRDRGRLIRQPAWVQELNTKVTKASEQLTQELGRDPQPAEVAERLNLPETSIYNVLATRELNCVVSLTATTDVTGECDSSINEKDSFEAAKLAALELPFEERLALEEAVNTLKTLEQQVIRLYFYEDLNQSEIARKLGISVNYSSYLLRRSIGKIKAVLENQQLAENAVLHPAETPAMMPQNISTFDAVSGLYTGAYLRARIAEEIARVRRYPTNFALMLACISAPPQENETTALTVAIGQILRQNTRIIDLIAYLDTDRFALLLPHTGREARVLGDRLSRQFSTLIPPGFTTPPFTFQYGFAVYPIDGTTVETLFKRAQHMMTVTNKE